MGPIDKAIGSKTDGSPLRTASDVLKTATSPEYVHMDSASCACNRLLEASKWHMPLRRHADDLVNLYFTRVHRMYPILHEHTFKKHYECFWRSIPAKGKTTQGECTGLCKQKSQGKTFPRMVHAVFSLSSLFRSGTPEENMQNAEEYFRLIQEVNLLDILDHEIGIELVQLGLLMGFYLQSTERFSKCWNITGLTIRMAQNMGLQLSLSEARRKGLFPPHATQLECEMRIRV